MRYNVIVSDRAKQMLGTHIKFLSKIDPLAARRTKERIMKGLRSLEEMPVRFPFFNEDYIPPNKYHKLFIENWYLVLFQVKDDTVYVDYIVDCREDYGWFIR